MCGIAGFLDLKRETPAERLEPLVLAMADTLSHRGPDDEGAWTDAEVGVAIASRRLAIRDLSVAGHQPMVSAGGRFVLVYNGEIYDTDGLRQDLEARGHGFRGTSDTEVLLNACAEWGPGEAVERCNGMFAFALWDREERILTLARDRLGIKPLYWARTGGLFLFGSELKALSAHPDWRPEIDRDSLAAYARLSYVPAPRCIWRGASKLEPGTLLTVRADGGEPVPTRYWDMAGIALQERTPMDMGEAADGLEDLLRRSVRRRLVADVPLGVFLSGGIDSSVVTALTQAEGAATVKTFTIGFGEAGFDESAAAEQVARHLGTDHASIALTAEEAQASIPELPRCFDEPFADSSQLPMVLVSRFARQAVTVALSGDGGDEVFGGYNRYAWADRHWPRLGDVPATLRRIGAAAIEAVPPRLWDMLASGLVRQPGEKFHKLASVMTADDIEEVHRRLISHGVDAADVVIGGAEHPSSHATPAGLDDPVERMQYLDTLTYLPDDILTKVDRATMSVGLEARVPLLDHEVVEFAWCLPLSLKVAEGTGKRVLREVLGRHLPSALFERPKSGFAVPLDAWLRGPLREWVDDLLPEETLRQQGYFDPAVVGAWWREHQSGRRNRHHALWNVLMFQGWLESQRTASVNPAS